MKYRIVFSKDDDDGKEKGLVRRGSDKLVHKGQEEAGLTSSRGKGPENQTALTKTGTGIGSLKDNEEGAHIHECEIVDEVDEKGKHQRRHKKRARRVVRNFFFFVFPKYWRPEGESEESERPGPAPRPGTASPDDSESGAPGAPGTGPTSPRPDAPTAPSPPPEPAAPPAHVETPERERPHLRELVVTWRARRAAARGTARSERGGWVMTVLVLLLASSIFLGPFIAHFRRESDKKARQAEQERASQNVKELKQNVGNADISAKGAGRVVGKVAKKTRDGAVNFKDGVKEGFAKVDTPEAPQESSQQPSAQTAGTKKGG